MAPGVILQSVSEAVVGPIPKAPPIAEERPEEEYPDTDAKPLAENTWQLSTMNYAGEALAIHFRGRAFVATDLLIYYRKGDQGATVAPNVMVVLGVDDSHRGSYRFWEEGGRVPDFVLEMSSSTTHENDEGRKRRIYARLGMREYFRYAPVSSGMPRMGGHRLVGEELREGRWEALLRLGRERIRSEVLSLELRVKGQWSEGCFRELRFFNPITGEDSRTLGEERQGRIQAERALNESGLARTEAECELAKLRVMLDQAPRLGASDASGDGM